jgi:hypothetical protein
MPETRVVPWLFHPPHAYEQLGDIVPSACGDIELAKAINLPRLRMGGFERIISHAENKIGLLLLIFICA